MKPYDASTYTAQNSVGYLVRRASSLIQDQLEAAFAGHGLTFVQWVTLMRLRDDPTLTAGSLCRDLRHDSGAFTRVIDHLEERGLVRRERSEADRRVVQLHLTSAGRHAVAALVPIVVGLLNGALRDFTAEEVATLTTLLRRLTSRLETGDKPVTSPPREATSP